MATANNMQVAPHIAARIAARKEAGTKSAVSAAILGDGNGLSFPKISIRAGRYRLVEDGVETPVGISLDVIIVGANPRTSKIFYAQAYDGNAEGVRPTCFSHDSIRPDTSVSNPVHSNCADCPNNVLGSKMLPSGQKSKLCADQRHLAVVPAADPNKVYALTVPVSGMKALREYFKELNNYGLIPEETITELSFDESASFPKVVFSRKGDVPEKALPRIELLTKSEEVKVATRTGTATAAPALAAPAAPQQLTLPGMDTATDAAVKNAQAFETAEDKAAPAPVVEPAAKKAAAPKKDAAPAPTTAELEAKLDSLFA